MDDCQSLSQQTEVDGKRMSKPYMYVPYGTKRYRYIDRYRSGVLDMYEEETKRHISIRKGLTNVNLLTHISLGSQVYPS